MCERAGYTHDDGTSRRRVLAVGGALLAASLAGCSSGDGGDDETPTATESGTTTVTPTDTETLGGTTTGGGARLEPVEPVPDDANCAVCGMVPAKFPDWNAQLATGDGEREFFCSPGCLVTYRAAPGRFTDGRTREDLTRLWVRDYDSTALVDASTATFVLDTDAERVGGPMMGNPVAFADAAAAEAYVEDHDDLGDADVVDLSAFDVETARLYRARFLPTTTATTGDGGG
jgi:nitrous oxide reductase accessory protein NosL